MGNSYTISLGKLEGKRPLGRPSGKWEVNTGMNHR
jgi:hypothetical protein